MADIRQAPAPLPASASEALAEPTRRVSARWIALWSLANFMMNGLLFGAGSILGPKLAEKIDPTNKIGVMALAGVLAGLIPLVANPLVGALTDRTTSRWGRRHPWILAGGLGTAVVFAVQALQTTVTGYLLTSLASGCLIAILGTALIAVVPDEVPIRQRATVSAWGGAVGGSAGLLVCTALVAVVVTDVSAGYAAMAALIAIGVLPFALFTRGVRLSRDDRPAFSLGRLFASLWVNPRREPDFWWAMGGRFLFFLANGLFTTYLYFFLQDAVHYPNPSVGVLILNAIYVVLASVAAVPLGRLSDRLLRRKNLTIVSASFQAAACLVVALLPTWTGAIAGSVLLGLGFGVYMSVDQALVTEVLPKATGRGKDLGLINMTVTLAALLAPAIAAPVLLGLGGYTTLFALAAVLGVGSAVLVQPIRKVR